MSTLRYGHVAGPLLGVFWTLIVAITVSVLLSFATGDPFRPSFLYALVVGALIGLAVLGQRQPMAVIAAATVFFMVLLLVGIGPVLTGEIDVAAKIVTGVLLGVGIGWPMVAFVGELPRGALTRHEFENSVIRFLTGFGYIFFTAIVVIPFYLMVMTSLKNQAQLIQNPLDFSIDFGQGWGLLRSYSELFSQFNLGSYLWNSFLVSVLTILITLAFAIPGAYSVARLQFRGRAAYSRSILLIYMVPMIVLALPIYIAFSMTGLRNTIYGIVLIYPVTTIPVALCMLQGYFRGLPSAVSD